MPQSPPRHPSQHARVAKKLQKRLAQKDLDPALRRFLQSQLKLVRALAKLPSPPKLPALPKPRQPSIPQHRPDVSNLRVKSPPPEASVSQQLLSQLKQGRPSVKVPQFKPQSQHLLRSRKR